MKPPPLVPALAALLALAVSTTPTRADVVFGPVRAGAGQSVHLVSRTYTEGGSIRLEKDGRTSHGTIVHSRERDLSWTFRDPTADGGIRGMVTVTRINTVTSVTLDGKTEKTDDASPLNGKMFAMSKSAVGDWKFELDGSVPMRRIDDEISELTQYLKRNWYPQRKVALGESWEFDPVWIRMLIARDLQKAQTIGTMNLRQIRHTAGGDTAIIAISIRSTGGDFQSDGSETSAKIELKGQVTVNMKTMLDESLELKGSVITRTGKPGNTKTVTLPLHLKVTKTLVNN